MTLPLTCSTLLQAYQLAAEGPIKLPPFQIGAVTPRGTNSPPALSALSPDDLAVCTLYGGIYAAYVDRRACHLYLYRFFRQAASAPLACAYCAQPLHACARSLQACDDLLQQIKLTLCPVHNQLLQQSLMSEGTLWTCSTRMVCLGQASCC